jgi:hypothetical protein
MQIPRAKILLTWPEPAESVFFTGDFVTSPWTTHIPMTYNRTLKLFYSRYFIENKLPSSTYKLKFIVDG